ncbi:MAG: Re/Si-specific NAD(P)(+) transhydrogenase subunit alpha [Gemmatimonadota bacterium]|nr:Re/Si-specific NAD(P)(+) transhydrogenase subunit alpha [Gemmatimonadota bacterium]
MRVGVPKETRPDERRVAVTPETARKLLDAGVDEVAVENGAGRTAAVPDEEYREEDARIVSADEAWSADLVLKVQPPGPAEAERLREGAALVCFLYPDANADAYATLLDRRVTAVAMESVPRIARAQKMDALSSMANIAGYKAVLEAANAFGRFFPLLMTAAGTVTPAHVLVIGAGVAGLSAIATARRLGAVTRAFDPRSAVRDQVESLGARFLELELEAAEETEGGYAGMQTEEFLEAERKLLAEHVAEVDVVVSSALVHGREAPVLITEPMVRSMEPGSIVVDLAVEQGGNCALSRPGETVDVDGVTVMGLTNLPSRLPVHASQLYARNVLALVGELLEEGELALDFADEVVDRVTIAHEGRDRREEPEPVPAGETALPEGEE